MCTLGLLSALLLPNLWNRTTPPVARMPQHPPVSRQHLNRSADVPPRSFQQSSVPVPTAGDSSVIDVMDLDGGFRKQAKLPLAVLRPDQTPQNVLFHVCQVDDHFGGRVRHALHLS